MVNSRELYLPVVLLLSAVVVIAPLGPAEAAGVSGYVEPAYGVRYSDDGPIDDRNVLNETRIMLENQWYARDGSSLDLRLLGKRVSGTGENDELEVREASVFLPVGRSLELTAGRQVLSWGPGQYEFVNDHFTKDYRSFFLGRDLEFMKAPSDALRLRAFSGYGNLDLALVPKFDANRNPVGRSIPIATLDYGLVSARQLTAGDTNLGPVLPEDSPDKGEVHARYKEMYGSWELALYGYRGRSGNPKGWDVQKDKFYYPELASGGFSARGPFWGGITWLEASYDDVRSDSAGESTFLPPDQANLMAGYEFEPGPDVSYLVQVHWLEQVDAETLRDRVEGTLPETHPWAESSRYRLQLATTRSYLEDRLSLSARGFAGLQVEDWYLRLKADYEWSDSVRLTAGSMHFGADNIYSRFGAVQENDMFYSRLRYSF